MTLWWLALALAQDPDAEVATPDFAIEGTTWSMSTPSTVGDGGLKLRLFETPDKCLVHPADTNERRMCPPFVDPERAEVRLGMRVEKEGAIPVALSAGDVEVQVPGRDGGLVDLVAGESFELVPYQPLGFRQLWVLLVDQSGSMYRAVNGERPVMEKVVGALLSDATVDAFFPEEGQNLTGVLLLSFTGQVRAVPDGPWQSARVLVDREQYRFHVDKLLDEPVAVGYTGLYDAVRTTLDEVMMSQEVRTFPGNDNADPAVVVLTDGFNNEAGSDTCATNAPKLTRLIRWIGSLPSQSGHQGTTLHTVGFGKPFSTYEPTMLPGEVTPQGLCGLEADRLINNNLETGRIDNVSLAYMALAGGGTAYVGEDPAGLAQFLGTTGATIHQWYGLHLRLPADVRKRMRMPLPLRIVVKRPRKLETRVTLFPHPWFDASPGEVPIGTTWAEPRPVLAATAWLLLGLGWTLGVFGFGVGAHHAWRALARRAAEREAPRV
jgi:hypothetical protein